MTLSSSLLSANRLVILLLFLLFNLFIIQESTFPILAVILKLLIESNKLLDIELFIKLLLFKILLVNIYPAISLKSIKVQIFGANIIISSFFNSFKF